jgi:CheY-like chemotaxis protein
VATDITERKRVEAYLCHLPILAVTAHAITTDHARVIQAGCNACISKPVDFKLLSQHLERWLDFSEGLKTAPTR